MTAPIHLRKSQSVQINWRTEGVRNEFKINNFLEQVKRALIIYTSWSCTFCLRQRWSFSCEYHVFSRQSYWWRQSNGGNFVPLRSLFLNALVKSTLEHLPSLKALMNPEFSFIFVFISPLHLVFVSIIWTSLCGLNIDWKRPNFLLNIIWKKGRVFCSKFYEKLEES